MIEVGLQSGEYRTSGMQEIGATLRALREAHGYSVRELGDAFNVSEAAITACESGAFQTIFPARVYARGFIKRLLLFLEVTPEEEQHILERFDSEWGVNGIYGVDAPHRAVGASKDWWRFTPQKIGIGAVAVSFLILGVFVASRVSVFLGAPLLSLDEPRLDAVFLRESVLHVKGRAEKESRLTMNGRELRIDEYGRFDEEVELPHGLNALEFGVLNRFGKVARETRYVVVE